MSRSQVDVGRDSYTFSYLTPRSLAQSVRHSVRILASDNIVSRNSLAKYKLYLPAGIISSVPFLHCHPKLTLLLPVDDDLSFVSLILSITRRSRTLFD